MNTALTFCSSSAGWRPSRERATALILSGVVLVNGQPAQKAGMPVAEDADIALKEPDHPYVGRGGIKLAHALDTFGVSVDGREALDIGASTGGFTDVLLKRGARRVVAFDVGHGQLDWGFATIPAWSSSSARTHAALEPAHLPVPVDIVTIDVSFISLRHIFPRVPPLLRRRRRCRGAREAAVRGGARRGRQEGRHPRSRSCRRASSRKRPRGR